MAKRKWSDIRKIEFVGGCLGFDFVNTTGMRASEPRERLKQFSDWVVFSQRSQLIKKSAASGLRKIAKEDPGRATATLAQILELRELLYRLFMDAINERNARRDDLVALNKWLEGMSDYRRLVWKNGKAEWDWVMPPDNLIAPCYRIVASSVELLQSPEFSTAKKCGECDWLFLDVSRNRGRQWCKKTCGDRVKSREYYRRKKQKLRKKL